MNSKSDLIESLRKQHPESAIFEIFELIDRKEFIPGLNNVEAYEDKPVPIGEFQNSLPPTVVVTLLDQLNLMSGNDVLEIGTGSGYMTACVFKKITPGKIITIERAKKLCILAKSNLSRKFPNAISDNKIRIFWENGLLAAERFPEESFDRIYFTCAVESKFNVDQFVKLLKPEGLLIVIVNQSAAEMEKENSAKKSEEGKFNERSEESGSGQEKANASDSRNHSAKIITYTRSQREKAFLMEQKTIPFHIDPSKTGKI